MKLLLLFLLGSVALGQGTNDPFKPTPPIPCEKPEPEPIPEVIYKYGCTYAFQVDATVRHDNKDKADKFCDFYGWDYCEVEKRNNRWVSIYGIKAEISSKGPDISQTRIGIFKEISNIVETKKLYLPDFKHTGNFIKCWELTGY